MSAHVHVLHMLTRASDATCATLQRVLRLRRMQRVQRIPVALRVRWRYDGATVATVRRMCWQSGTNNPNSTDRSRFHLRKREATRAS